MIRTGNALHLRDKEKLYIFTARSSDSLSQTGASFQADKKCGVHSFSTRTWRGRPPPSAPPPSARRSRSLRSRRRSPTGPATSWRWSRRTARSDRQGSMSRDYISLKIKFQPCFRNISPSYSQRMVSERLYLSDKAGKVNFYNQMDHDEISNQIRP